MAFDLNSITIGRSLEAPRIELYGPHGVGKNTWAAGAPNPVFIRTEDGMGLLKSARFPIATSVAHIHEAISHLYHDDHDFQTVVLDSADWLESIIAAEVIAAHEPKELAYGKDAIFIADQWRVILEGFDALRSTKNMIVIILAHAEVKRFDPPDGDSYDRYQPKLSKYSNAVVQEWADLVLFANWKTYVKKEVVANAGTKNPTTKSKALDTIDEPVLYTGKRPAHLAKNRFNLPPELPLYWADFDAAMKQAQLTAS